MAQVNKIDSNVTGLSFAWEDSAGVLPGTPVWIPLEPNSYNAFGAQLSRLNRELLAQDRQRKKGVISDLDASGGFTHDLTQKGLAEIMQGFLFANFRRKGEAKNDFGVTDLEISATAATSRLTRTSGSLDLTTEFAVGDLVFVQGFSDPANNGLFTVAAVSTTTLDLDETGAPGTPASLVDEAASSDVSVVQVGVQPTTAADIQADADGSRPALTSTTLDFTTLGLNVGEFVYIGGDTIFTRFTENGSNGWARVRSISANRLEFDKTAGTFANDNAAGIFLQLFFGRVLKNESNPANIVKKYLQLERQLGAPDSAQPAEIQSEYLTGALANEMTLRLSQASKVEADLGFVAANHETRDGPTGVKSGTRISSSEITGDIFNTSSDVARVKLSIVDENDSNPTPLFAFATDFDIVINNGVTPDKAIGVLGGFDTTIGDFTVSGNLTVYFSTVEAVEAVRNNSDVTLDFILVAANAGIAFDLPLIALGDAQANIEADRPITLPISHDAATAAGIDANLDHTLLISFFDYLPNAAG